MDQDWPNENELQRDDIEAALSRCRPLHDPVRHWYKVAILGAVFSTILGFLVGFVESGGNLFERLDDGDWSIILFIAIILLVTIIFYTTLAWLSLRPLVRSRHCRKVLYVRAFNRDDESLLLRKLVRAALPVGFALEGIRQPRKRSSWFMRLIGPAFVALKYAGSEQFELEAADHNWLARLLATSRKASAIVIDATEVTRNVNDEIKLAVLVGGMKRCVFLIRESQSSEEVAEDIARQTGLEVGDLEEMRWIHVPDDLLAQKETFLAECRSKFAGLLPDELGVNAKALKFVQSKVSEENWATSWRSSQGAKTLAVFIFALLMGSVLPKGLQPKFAIGFTIAFGLYYYFTLVRLWRVYAFDRRFGRLDWKVPFALVIGGISFAIFGA